MKHWTQNHLKNMEKGWINVILLTEGKSQLLVSISVIFSILSFVILGNMYSKTQKLKENIIFSRQHDIDIQKNHWDNIRNNLINTYKVNADFVEIANYENKDGINYDNISTQYWEIYLKNNKNPDYNIADEKTIEIVKKEGYKFSHNDLEIKYYPESKTFKVENVEISNKAYSEGFEIPSTIITNKKYDMLKIKPVITNYTEKLKKDYIKEKDRENVIKKIENDINYNGLFRRRKV